MSKLRVRIFGIGKRIGETERAVRVKKTEILYANKEREDLLTTLTPITGWEGKNEGERTISRNRFCLESPEIQAVDKRIRDLDFSMAELESALSALEAERRSLEFVVRDALASTLFGYDDEVDLVQNQHFDNLETAVSEVPAELKEVSTNTLPVAKKSLTKEEQEKIIDELYGPQPKKVAPAPVKSEVKSVVSEVVQPKLDLDDGIPF